MTSSGAANVNAVAALPLFRGFTAEELEQVATCFVEETFRKGEAVCRAGDTGDTFYVVLSGELEVWGGGTPARIMNRLQPGEFFGELALLTGSPRTATITAARTTHVLALHQADFDRLILHNAKALETFAQVLCKRMATIARGDAIRRASTVILVTAAEGLRGKSVVAAALAGLLQHLTDRPVLAIEITPRDPGRTRRGVRLLDVAATADGEIRRRLGRAGAVAHLTLAATGAADEAACATNLTALLERTARGFPFIVIEAGPEAGAVIGAAKDIADHVVEIVAHWEPAPDGAGDAYSYLPVTNLHNPESQPIAINHMLPFVLPQDDGLEPIPARRAAAYVLENPHAPVAASLRRLARKILGLTVGVALGGGAAFGVAHVGVLEVLEANEIPIDLLTGCSMGSIVAIGYAAGIHAAQMKEIAHRIGTKRVTLSALDFTLTRPGLLAGNRLVRIFAPLSGAILDFDQLTLPCRVVATDIETGECVQLRTGRLDIAFRASCSVPMVWAPVEHDGRVLVDGGVNDPLPVASLKEMGADICLAVNVVPPPRKGVETVVSRATRLLKRLDPTSYLSGSRNLPSMIDVVMNSLQTLQYELGNFKAITADVQIKPDLSGFTWIEFYRARELIERGAEAAAEAITDIKRVLAERLTARLPPV